MLFGGITAADAQLPVGVDLSYCRIQRPLQPSQLWVEQWHRDADQGSVSEGRSFLSQAHKVVGSEAVVLNQSRVLLLHVGATSIPYGRSAQVGRVLSPIATASFRSFGLIVFEVYISLVLARHPYSPEVQNYEKSCAYDFLTASRYYLTQISCRHGRLPILPLRLDGLSNKPRLRQRALLTVPEDHSCTRIARRASQCFGAEVGAC